MALLPISDSLFQWVQHPSSGRILLGIAHLSSLELTFRIIEGSRVFSLYFDVLLDTQQARVALSYPSCNSHASFVFTNHLRHYSMVAPRRDVDTIS